MLKKIYFYQNQGDLFEHDEQNHWATLLLLLLFKIRKSFSYVAFTYYYINRLFIHVKNDKINQNCKICNGPKTNKLNKNNNINN